MHYDGKPRHPVPSKRYDIFIKAFEKQVAEVQKKVEAMNRMQKLYEAVRVPLEAANLPNATDFLLTEYGVTVRIDVLPEDRKITFDRLAAAIAESMVDAGVRNSESDPPDVEGNEYGFGCTIFAHKVKCHIGLARVSFSLNVPWDGTKLIEVQTSRREEMRTIEERKLIWHERSYISPQLTTVAKNAPEMPF